MNAHDTANDHENQMQLLTSHNNFFKINSQSDLLNEARV